MRKNEIIALIELERLIKLETMAKKRQQKNTSDRVSRLPFKGKQPKRGQGIYYSTPKRAINLSLTPVVIKRLEELGLAQNPVLSKSEVIEQLIRGKLKLPKTSRFDLSE